MTSTGCAVLFSYVIGVVIADSRTTAPGQPDFVRHVAGHDTGPLPQLEGIRPYERIGKLLYHVPVHALNDRHHGDEKRHPNEHPDQREETLQLLRAKSSEGHPDCFQQPHQDEVASRVLVVSAWRTLAPSF